MGDASQPRLEGTVLVADDDAAILGLVVKRLEAVGLTTVAAGDGTSALELIRQRPIDLAVLDIMMPGLDGYEVLRHLRREHAVSELPVIMLSAKTGGEDVIRALHLGANDYALKPVDFALLIERIARHLALKAPQAQMLGGYRIERKIGEGGMGIVFEASRPGTNRRVALKVMPRAMTVDALFLQRFRQEAELASRVDHPNVVRVVETGVDGETHFMVMELVEGIDLADTWEKRPMGPGEAIQVMRQVAMGLHAVHGAGIVHRDVKPENIILTKDGIAKVIDLGIARDVGRSSRLTDTGIGVGSIAYAAPEQLDGHGEVRSDIYAFGCTLYFALTGQDPFEAGKPVEWYFARKRRRPPRLDEVEASFDRELVQLVADMMSPAASRRPPDFAAVVLELDRVAVPAIIVRWPSLVLRGAAVAAVAGAVLVLWRLFAYG